MNWKYLFTELALIVAGILLAINLNSWNANRKLDEQVKLSIVKIQEELKHNIEELENVIESNQEMSDFYVALNRLIDQDADQFTCRVEDMTSLRSQYQNYFEVLDSTKVSKDQYEYRIDLAFELEYGEMRDIAWRTAQLTQVINEFEYNCLGEIISVYGFQELFNNVQNKFLDMGIIRDREVYISTYQLNHQLAQDLLGRCKALEKEIEQCAE